MTTINKQFRLPAADAQQMREFAAIAGGSVSETGREWITNFLENGSDLVVTKDPGVKVQVFVDGDIAAAAERKAREEYGCSLRDVILHEIAETRKM